jgi:hypothetical protein
VRDKGQRLLNAAGVLVKLRDREHHIVQRACALSNVFPEPQRPRKSVQVRVIDPAGPAKEDLVHREVSRLLRVQDVLDRHARRVICPRTCRSSVARPRHRVRNEKRTVRVVLGVEGCVHDRRARRRERLEAGGPDGRVHVRAQVHRRREIVPRAPEPALARDVERRVRVRRPHDSRIRDVRAIPVSGRVRRPVSRGRVRALPCDDSAAARAVRERHGLEPCGPEAEEVVRLAVHGAVDDVRRRVPARVPPAAREHARSHARGRHARVLVRREDAAVERRVRVRDVRRERLRNRVVRLLAASAAAPSPPESASTHRAVLDREVVRLEVDVPEHGLERRACRAGTN